MGRRSDNPLVIARLALGLLGAVGCGGRASDEVQSGPSHGGVRGATTLSAPETRIANSFGGQPGANSDSSTSVGGNAVRGLSDPQATTGGTEKAGRSGTADSAMGGRSAGAVSVAMAAGSAGIGSTASQLSADCPELAPLWSDCADVADPDLQTSCVTEVLSPPTQTRLTRISDGTLPANALREATKRDVRRQYYFDWLDRRAMACHPTRARHLTSDPTSPCVPDPDPPPGQGSDPPPPVVPDPAPEPEAGQARHGRRQSAPGTVEPDRWQLDGQYLYVLTANQLLVLDVAVQFRPTKIASLPLEGVGKGLLVRNDRALVVASPNARAARSCPSDYDCQFTGDGKSTLLFVVDLSARAIPKLIRRVELSGSYLGGALLGSVAHLVTRDSLAVPELSWPRQNLVQAPSAAEAAALLETQCREAMTSLATAEVTLSLPIAKQSRVSSDGSLGPLTAIVPREVLWSEGPATDALSITSVDLASPEDIQQELIYSRPGAVHFTPNLLWLAVPEVHAEDWELLRDTTWIHGFDLVGTAAVYRDSTRVAGHVSNRFALDDHLGTLRIATTTSGTSLPRSGQFSSSLSILDWTEDSLIVSSTLDDIAPNSFLHAVQFTEQRAYISIANGSVLHAFDLSIRGSEKPLGSIDAGGTVEHLQALEDTRLLTIDSTRSNDSASAYFPLNDVSAKLFDLSHDGTTNLLSNAAIGTVGTERGSDNNFSDKLWLEYFAAPKLLALPVSLCGPNVSGQTKDTLTFSGLRLYNTSNDKDLLPIADVPLSAPSGFDQSRTCAESWFSAAPPVSRILINDSVLYGLSESTLEVIGLSDPPSSRGSIELSE